MTIEIAAFRKQFTRRAALGGAVAMVAAPGFAEDCRIGPPAHAKGPLVWMDMDQVELDAAYDQAFYAPLRLEVLKRLASMSEEVRNRIGRPMRESYGATPVEQLDIYRTKRAKAPIFVFIHGGAWLGGEAKNYGQNRDFAAAVKAAGKPVELIETLHFNHFEILESLGNPYGPNGRAALTLMKLSSV
jgi:acetyl esterase/lipase